MIIRHVEIERFRGIKSLIWTVNSSMVCLLGPGNSCKTTILDAIALALSPRWSASFTDSDFFDCDTTQPVNIAVTVGELPNALLNCDRKFGRFQRGWSKDTGLIDEPTDSTDAVLTVQLTIDQSLDPTWTVITDRNPEGKPISSHDRELLGALLLGGSFLERELTWNRNSILTRFTSNNHETSAVLSRLHRSLRQGLDTSQLGELNRAARKAQESSASFGVRPQSQFQPFLDTQIYGSISLHDGDVPVRQSGIGDRRLLTMALQHTGITEGGILLVDEIEQGLEPHRLRNLIKVLRPTDVSASDNVEPITCGQTLLTTHSPIAVSELLCSEIHAVRRWNDGSVHVLAVPDSLVKHIKKTPEAMLARKIIVCEGKTEYGLCQILDQLPPISGDSSLAYLGVIPVVPPDGAGRTVSPKLAEAFRDLGFAVAYFGDADEPLVPSQQELQRQGIEVVLWADNYRTEQRVFSDLPWAGVLRLCEVVVERRGSVQSVIATITSANNLKGINPSAEMEQWLEQFSQDEARSYLATASVTASAWFKSAETAESLATTVLNNFNSIAGTDLATKLARLKSWACELSL